MPTSGLFPRWATSLPHSLAAPHSRSHAPAASPTHLTFWAWRRAERGAVPPAPHSLNQAAAPPPYSPDHSTCHPTQGGHLLTLGQPRPFCRPENFPFLGFSGIPPPFQRPTANPSAVTPWAQPTSDPRTPMGIKNLGGGFPGHRLWALPQGFWFRRSGVGPENVHFSQVRRQCLCCWSRDPTLRASVPILSLPRMPAFLVSPPSRVLIRTILTCLFRPLSSSLMAAVTPPFTPHRALPPTDYPLCTVLAFFVSSSPSLLSPESMADTPWPTGRCPHCP